MLATTAIWSWWTGTPPSFASTSFSASVIDEWPAAAIFSPLAPPNIAMPCRQFVWARTISGISDGAKGGGVRALVLLHDHLSSGGFVADHLRHLGWRVDSRVVVPASRFRSPGV